MNILREGLNDQATEGTMHYGIDIGGTKIELGVFDVDFSRLSTFRAATPTDDYGKLVRTLDMLVAKADSFTRQTGTIGVGIPGVIDRNGNILSSNIPCVAGKDLCEDFATMAKRPVIFENDVNAFAFSELHGGPLKHTEYGLGLIIGTGLAGTFAAHGKLCYGHQKIAGEIGHIPLSAALQQKYDFPFRSCGCGLAGCFETVVSGSGLRWLCRQLKSPYTRVHQLIAALEHEEDEALRVFEVYLDCLGCFLAQLTLAYDPEVIVLGGGVSSNARIYPNIQKHIKNYLFSSAESPRVVPAQFGPTSGTRGAAIIGAKKRERLS